MDDIGQERIIDVKVVSKANQQGRHVACKAHPKFEVAIETCGEYPIDHLYHLASDCPSLIRNETNRLLAEFNLKRLSRLKMNRDISYLLGRERNIQAILQSIGNLHCNLIFLAITGEIKCILPQRDIISRFDPQHSNCNMNKEVPSGNGAH